MKCLQREILYIVLPYFNFCAFRRRRELFVDFVRRIQDRPGIRIVVVECRSAAPLPKMKVWRHIRCTSQSDIWIKESLVNHGVQSLPNDWTKMAWIDADITFLNERWVEDTLDALDTWDVVQMFHSALNLGPSGDLTKVDKGFAFMYRGSGTPYTKTDRYGYWHPGYAWACTRKAWARMNGLIDWAILGSADRHMAMAFIGKVLDSAPGNIHKNYKQLLVDFQNRVRNLKLSWIDGTIVHHWHGSLANRRYRERWDILTKLNYDPFIDVGLTLTGVVQLTASGERLRKPIEEYFVMRSEDD